MKNIHDILSEYEITIPEDKKKDFDKAVLENYKTVADYTKQGEKLTLAEEKVATTEEALKAFEGVDVEKLQGEITKLQGDLATKDTDYQQRIADMEFNSLLDAAIGTAKGRNPKALRGLLDVDTLKASKNQTEDIKTALEALKESDGYLFESTETPPPYDGGTGTKQVPGNDTFAFDFGGVRPKPTN